MHEALFTLDTVDGATVNAWHWTPDESPVRGVVQIAHGLAEHAARYRPTAEDLTAAGWAVVADDHRGHGLSAPAPDDLGFFAAERGWALVLDDLHRLTQHARDLHPGVPVVLLGHSMGSFLAQQYLFTFPEDVQAAVLSGSSGPIGLEGEAGAVVARIERARLGPRGRSPVLHGLAFGAFNKAFAPNRTDYDWLSRDEAQVDRYIDDPLCGFEATTQLWSDLLAGTRVIAQAPRLATIRSNLPVYLCSGELDPVGGAAGVAALQAHYERAGLTNVTSRVYAGARHEVLNEVNRDEVVADLLDWLDRQVPRPGTD